MLAYQMLAYQMLAYQMLAYQMLAYQMLAYQMLAYQMLSAFAEVRFFFLFGLKLAQCAQVSFRVERKEGKLQAKSNFVFECVLFYITHSIFVERSLDHRTHKLTPPAPQADTIHS
jgi:hypothetical protein